MFEPTGPTGPIYIAPIGTPPPTKRGRLRRLWDRLRGRRNPWQDVGYMTLDEMLSIGAVEDDDGPWYGDECDTATIELVLSGVRAETLDLLAGVAPRERPGRHVDPTRPTDALVERWHVGTPLPSSGPFIMTWLPGTGRPHEWRRALPAHRSEETS